MDYKNSILFKELNNTDVTVNATIDAGEYDMKFTFSVVDMELQTRVYAVIGRLMETPIHVGREFEEDIFTRVCEDFKDEE